LALPAAALSSGCGVLADDRLRMSGHSSVGCQEMEMPFCGAWALLWHKMYIDPVMVDVRHRG